MHDGQGQIQEMNKSWQWNMKIWLNSQLVILKYESFICFPEN